MSDERAGAVTRPAGVAVVARSQAEQRTVTGPFNEV